MSRIDLYSFFLFFFKQIMCFTAFSVVSLVVAIVSIQLLRLGLVNQTTDGNIYAKPTKDALIIVALGLAGSESLICLITAFVSCRMARAAKKELYRRREGTFHVQVVGDKDIVVVNKKEKKQIALLETSSGGRNGVENLVGGRVQRTTVL